MGEAAGRKGDRVPYKFIIASTVTFGPSTGIKVTVEVPAQLQTETD